jgi:hypothetical protein
MLESSCFGEVFLAIEMGCNIMVFILNCLTCDKNACTFSKIEGKILQGK